MAINTRVTESHWDASEILKDRSSQMNSFEPQCSAVNISFYLELEMTRAYTIYIAILYTHIYSILP